ncbi:MAG: hypothetical protein R2748_26135 [Bryobacterales bacterium]
MGAGAISALTALVTYRASGQYDGHFVVSALLAIAFTAAYVALRIKAPPEHWVRPAGIVTILLTQLNVMAALLSQLTTPSRNAGLADPTAVFLMLIAGTLWAMRVLLDTNGVLWAAMISLSLLWMPWIGLVDAPVKFLMIALACVGAGAQMQWIAAQRAYDAYRRETVWPQLWDRHLAQALGEQNEANRRPAPPDDNGGMRSSLMSMALVLDKRRANAAREPTRADSQA